MMKGKLKKAICMALATTMVVSMTACFGKDGGGDTSDALAQASDSANAKEAVFKEIGSINPEAVPSLIAYTFALGTLHRLPRPVARML